MTDLISRIATFLILGSLALGTCRGQEKTNEAADAQAEALKMGLETLISYKEGGLPVSDEGFENGLKELLKLREKGSLKAPEVILAIAKKDKPTVLRVLKSLRKDVDEDGAKTIDGLVAKIDPKKEDKKEAATTNEKADLTATNVKAGIDTLLGYREGGLPVSDEGIQKGVKELIKLYDDGSLKAPTYVVEISKKEKKLVLDILKTSLKDADEEKGTRLKALIEKIDPKKKEEKK